MEILLIFLHQYGAFYRLLLLLQPLLKKFPLILFLVFLFFLNWNVFWYLLNAFISVLKLLFSLWSVIVVNFINIFYIEYRIHSTWSWNYPPKFCWIQFSNTLCISSWVKFLWTINHILIDPRLHLQFVFIHSELSFLYSFLLLAVFSLVYVSIFKALCTISTH